MSNLEFSFAMTEYDRVMPLITGEVQADGVDLDFKGMPGAVPRVFYEQIKFNRYDVSEMSMSSYLRMRPEGFPYRMLPVFHNRQFSYTNIYIRKSSGIRQDHPEDLKGKRFGIQDYQQSVGLWTRGILKLEWGIEPEDMIWYQERGEHLSHTGASAEAGLSIPEAVELRYAKRDFGSMYL
ncbi:MAG: ABC transporter substrate-binding protein, partial [Chloroflexi bacterium]|nr:ABC transporter substrate-binding protein [Chloroflexota bacterium]